MIDDKTHPAKPSASSPRPKKNGAVAAAIQRFEMATLLNPPTSTHHPSKAFVTPPVSPQKFGALTKTQQEIPAATKNCDESMSPASSQVGSSFSPQSTMGTSHEAAATDRTEDETLETRSFSTIKSTNTNRSRSFRTSRRMAIDGVPTHVIPLPPPPSDCGSVNMSTGSVTLTVFSQDSFVNEAASSWIPPTKEHSPSPCPPELPLITSNIPPASPDPEPQQLRTAQDFHEECSTSLGQKSARQAPTLPPLSPVTVMQQTKQPAKSSLRSGTYSCNNSSTGNATESTGSSSPGYPYQHGRKKKTSFSPLPPQECVIPADPAVTKTDMESQSNLNGKDPSDSSSITSSRKKGCKRGTIMYYLFGVALCLIIVAVGVNLLLYFDREATAGSSPSSSSSGNQTSSPIDDDAVVENFNDERPPASAPADATVTSSIADSIAELLTTQFRIVVPSSTSTVNSPARQAVDWMAFEILSSGQNPTTALDTYSNNLLSLAQRFALLVLRYSLVGGDNLSNPTEDVSKFIQYPTANVDVCQWVGVICDAPLGSVIEIDYSDIGLKGSIPTEIRLLPSLQVIDLSHNEIQGTIPEELYYLRQLKDIYIYMNQLQGSISTSIGQLSFLEVLHVSHNNLSGSIPQQLQSSGNQTRPLRYVNLHSNSLSGTIPSKLNLGQVTYFDAGRNQLTGTIPDDLGTDFIRLRQLLLDHNSLRGTIPTTIPTVGNGRLEVLEVNNNALSGSVPDNFSVFDKLVQVRLDNNNFDSLGPQNCILSLFSDFGGELIEFKADCAICSCNDIFCENMCNLQTGSL